MTRPAGRARPVPGPQAPAPPPADPVGALEVAGIVACCLTGALAGLVCVLLTPLYWGSVLVPVAVVLAAAGNVALPILAALPFVLWLIVVVGLGSSRPEGDVLLPAGKGAQPWVTYGMLLAGALAGGITLATQIGAPSTGRSGPERQPVPGHR
jgi:hypothetical protein